MSRLDSSQMIDGAAAYLRKLGIGDGHDLMPATDHDVHAAAGGGEFRSWSVEQLATLVLGFAQSEVDQLTPAPVDERSDNYEPGVAGWAIVDEPAGDRVRVAGYWFDGQADVEVVLRLLPAGAVGWERIERGPLVARAPGAADVDGGDQVDAAAAMGPGAPSTDDLTEQL